MEDNTKPTGRESRSMECEFRIDKETNEIVGRIPYNKETVIGDWFREVIRPSFFARAMAEGDDVVAWAEHGNGHLPFSRSTVTGETGTLRFINHSDHLEWRARPVDASDVDSLMSRIRAGVINATSFAFSVDDGNPDQVRIDRSQKDRLPLRELLSAERWYDVAPVTFAAYDNTSVGFRSAESVFNDHVQSTTVQECSDDSDDADATVQECGDRRRRVNLIRLKNNMQRKEQ